MRLRRIFSPADGDTALLDELADRVFDALDELPDSERLGATVAVICRHEMGAVR
ncbi:hypothetical protein [Mycobacterium heckeshornense]|uniref:hypothetical protein n=1 Tax=Mycobacterium heckeshornense TaxID=110505 RepID=UPI001558DAEE|nr:hypothetical protein [Mycobacterium heckeshornense]